MSIQLHSHVCISGSCSVYFGYILRICQGILYFVYTLVHWCRILCLGVRSWLTWHRYCSRTIVPLRLCWVRWRPPSCPSPVLSTAPSSSPASKPQSSQTRCAFLLDCFSCVVSHTSHLSWLIFCSFGGIISDFVLASDTPWVWGARINLPDLQKVPPAIGTSPYRYFTLTSKIIFSYNLILHIVK